MTQVYLNEHIMSVMEDPDALRELDSYLRIKSLINGRFGLIARNVDWQQIKQECTALASQTDIDFLCSSYLTVASTKVQGLDGFAWGLELLLSAYLADTEHQSLAALRKREMLEWVANQVINELEAIAISYCHLRALYRCERTLQELYELSQRFQPNDVPNLEAIACVVFEHVDTLETQFNIQCDDENNGSNTISKELNQSQLPTFLLALVALILTGIGVGCVFFGVSYFGLFGR